MVESINLSIDYVPVKKFDDMKKLCTKRYERIKKLEAELDNIRLLSGASYKLPVTSVAAMKNMKIINRRCVQALKGE